jgi:hypothetical protein
MIGRYGIAHACPVEGKILTAAHVAEVTVEGRTIQLGYTFQQGDSHGFLTGQSGLFSRDLAPMTLDEGDVTYFPLAEAAIQDSKVFWQEFDISVKPLRLVTRSAKVGQLVSGHFTFKPGPSPGASGGCVFDESGNVVGIVTWTVGPGVGVAVNLTGPNWPWELAQ